MKANTHFGRYWIGLAIKRFFEVLDKEFFDSHMGVKMHILEHHVVAEFTTTMLVVDWWVNKG